MFPVNGKKEDDMTDKIRKDKEIKPGRRSGQNGSPSQDTISGQTGEALQNQRISGLTGEALQDQSISGPTRESLQDRRLAGLVEAFKADSGQYKDLATPADREGRRRLLRSLMNIRMPGALPENVLRIQDEYLQERAAEKGIVRPEQLPEIRAGLSIWQGDITRLAVDAIVNAANSQMLGCFVPMHTCIDKATHIRITHPSNCIMASC